MPADEHRGAPIASRSPGIGSAAVIDVHAHVRLQATTGAAGRHGPEFGTDENGKPWYRVGNYKLVGVKHTGSPFTDPELRLKSMQEAQIDFQVLSPSPLTYFHHRTGEALAFADAIKPWRNSCELILTSWAASRPADAGSCRARRAVRAVRELGLWGPRSAPSSTSRCTARLDPFYATLVELDVPLFIHPAPAGIDGPPGDRISSASTWTSSSASARRRLSRFDIRRRARPSSQARRMDQPRWRFDSRHGRAACTGCDEALGTAAQKKDGAFSLCPRLWFDTHVSDERAVSTQAGCRPRPAGIRHNFAGWDNRAAATTVPSIRASRRMRAVAAQGTGTARQ
jgi:aminocarboxymuconate-semialdehyde decarboxylase